MLKYLKYLHGLFIYIKQIIASWTELKKNLNKEFGNVSR